MLEVRKLDANSVETISDLYQEFASLARSYYRFEVDPLDYLTFTNGVSMGLIKGFYAVLDDEPIGFMLYTVEEHGSLEVNIVHVTEDFIDEEIDQELLKAFVEEAKSLENWKVISYAMLGGQSKFVYKMNHLGFKLVGQAIVIFSLEDTIAPQIAMTLQLPELPEGYKLDSWKPTYQQEVSKIIYNSFSKAPDAKFDPRFRSEEGSALVVDLIAKSQIGTFEPDCTTVLLKDEKPVGICFANLTTQTIGNIPLIGINPEVQGNGFSVHMLKSTVTKIIQAVVDGKLSVMEVNATVETDNFPALKMYRKVGFRESYNYPQAYMDREVLFKDA